MKEPNKRSRRNFKGTKGGDIQPVAVNDNLAGPGESIQAKPLEVKVFGGNFEKAQRAFRALVQKERVLSSYKERQSYEKPSDKHRRKINESKRKQMEFCSKGECVHMEHSQNRKKNSRHNSSPE